KSQTRTPPARRRSHQTSQGQNVEDLVLIWLDVDSNKTDDDVILNKLRSIVNYIKIFDQLDECINYIKSITNEKIFLIVSDQLSKQLIIRVYNEPQIDSIYVFSSDSTAIVEHHLYAKKHEKIRNIYTSIDPLCKQMKWDTEVCLNDLISVASIAEKINIGDNSTFNNQETSFMYLQLMKEILVNMEYAENTKEEFVEFCRDRYKNNPRELESINEFEQDYSPNEAITCTWEDCLSWSRNENVH
ncbi:unnamed protein product, partial [Didymodactylos carnosus]